MGRAPLQYSPEQVLEAGRRAEVDGKIEYAIQFYRYVTDRYASSGEAQEAQLGLLRIAEAHGGIAVSDAHIESALASTAANGGVAAAESLSRLKQKSARGASKPEPGAGKAAALLAAPLPRRSGQGRLLPFACVTAGLLAVAGGIAIAVMGFMVETDGRSAATGSAIGGALIGSIISLAGLGTALAGQIGLAVLANAETTRALLEVELRKAGET